MLRSNSATFQQIGFLTGGNQANKVFWLFVSFVLFCSSFFNEPHTRATRTTGIASNAENFVNIASPRKIPTAAYSHIRALSSAGGEEASARIAPVLFARIRMQK